jgi:uncharacterized protein YkwD
MNQIFKGAVAILTFASCATTQQSTVKKDVPPSAVIKPIEKNSLIEVVDFQKEFLKQLNKIRAEGCKCGDTYMPPVEPVSWNGQLQLAALGHAQDMARNKYFSHVSKNGDKIKERITAAGYTPTGYKSFAIGENIAFNQRSIKEVMKGWKESPSHCKNLMSPAFKEVGIAMQNYYWVQDFGGRIPFGKR